jgi:hypothetical protein
MATTARAAKFFFILLMYLPFLLCSMSQDDSATLLIEINDIGNLGVPGVTTSVTGQQVTVVLSD